MVWEPIESAPKDGTDVLLFFPALHSNPAFASVGRFVNGGFNDGHAYRSYTWSVMGSNCHPEPTHWAAIPEAPIQSAEGSAPPARRSRPLPAPRSA